MSHITDLENIHLLRPSVVTIGVFDGVHRGHQHLIRSLVDEAHQNNRLAVVLTFFPHPDVVIRGITDRYYLTTAEQRAQLLLDLGVDYVVTHPFNAQTRQIRAGDFVDLLIRHLKINELWVGADFALGYKREGNVVFLTEAGKTRNFSVHVVDMVQTASMGQTISSTLIRELLSQGKVEKVADLLGRSYRVSGTVIEGKKRGRTLGFPTANMAVWDQQLIPMNGVYAGWATLGDERFMAMTNIGVSPTFDNPTVTVEPYLLDFDRDIYGETMELSFERFLRPEAKFNGLDALVAQIQKDVDTGRALLSAMAKNAQP